MAQELDTLPALWQVPYGGLAALALVTLVFGYVCVRRSRPGRSW